MAVKVTRWPCAVANCIAMVTRPGHRCKIHKVWNNGPFERPCSLCNQPIGPMELWAYRGNSFDHPVHAACVNRKSRPRKHAPKQLPLLP